MVASVLTVTCPLWFHIASCRGWVTLWLLDSKWLIFRRSFCWLFRRQEAFSLQLIIVLHKDEVFVQTKTCALAPSFWLIFHTTNVFSISTGSASETSESLEKREEKKKHARTTINWLLHLFSSVCENTSLLQRFCFMSVSEELENRNTTQDQKNNLGSMVITDYLLKLTGSVVFQEPRYILLDILLIDKLSQYITLFNINYGKTIIIQADLE